MTFIKVSTFSMARLVCLLFIIDIVFPNLGGSSKQPLNFTIIVHLNIHKPSVCWQPRDGHDLSCQCIQVTSTSRASNLSDRNSKPSWNTLQTWVVRQRILGLGNTDWQLIITLFGICFNLLLGQWRQLNTRSTVHLGGDSQQFVLNSVVNIIKILLLFQWCQFNSFNNRLGKLNCTSTSLGPVVGWNSKISTCFQRLFLNQLNLSSGVSFKLVDGNNNWDIVFFNVGNLLGQVGTSLSRYSRFSLTYSSGSG